MNNKWNRNNALWMLLPPIIIRVFRRVQAPGAAGIIVSVLITNAYMKKHTGIDK